MHDIITTTSQSTLRKKPRIFVHWIEPTVHFKGRITRQLVILIHGSHSLGEWQNEIERVLDVDGFDIVVKSVRYTGVSLLGVLLWPTRNSVYEDVHEQIREFTELYSDRAYLPELTFIAHSYGTYLLARFLGSQAVGWVNRAILLASIARNSDIDKMAGRTQTIINDVCLGDRAPCWAEAFRWGRFQATGVYGAKIRRTEVKNRFFDGDHVTHVRQDHFRERILPVIRGEQMPTGHPGPTAWIGYVDMLRFGVPVGLLTLIAAFAIGARRLVDWLAW